VLPVVLVVMERAVIGAILVVVGVGVGVNLSFSGGTGSGGGGGGGGRSSDRSNISVSGRWVWRKGSRVCWNCRNENIMEIIYNIITYYDKYIFC
jgi:hypothetical protein